MYIVPIKPQCKLNPKSHTSPIRLKWSSILFLKVFNKSHSTTTDGGELFHVDTILCEKLFLLTSTLAFTVSIIKMMPSELRLL